MSRPRPRGPVAIAGLALAAALALPIASPKAARAQMPQHRLDAAFPPGGKAGEAVEVRLVGGDLESAEGLWFDHPALRAERVEGDASPPKFRVTIATDAPAGLHDVRVVGPLGVSNPRAFAVGHRPEAIEQEPNNGPEQAGEIAVGQVVNGQIDGATDVDWFRFDGKTDQRVLLSLDASRLDAPLDAELRLFDADGRELAYSHDDLGRDPMIDAVLPADGSYRVEVRDVVYDGSPAHVYRLTLHDGPHVDAIVPRAAEPGTTATFTLLGRNLGGEPSGVVLPDGQVLERKAVTIDVPGDLAIDPDRPGVGRVASPAGGIRGFWYLHENDQGPANPVFVAESMATVVVEEEPARPSDAMTIGPPCDVSGDFCGVGDVDRYRFEAKKDQVWMVEVFAERVGSPVDPTLLVQRVMDDGSLRDVAEADDQDVPGTASRFATGTVDPSLRFRAPEDGTYLVTVGDLFNAPVPTPEAVYRLVIRPESPDFLLFATPADAGRPEGVTLRAGGRAAAYVLAHRLDGFDRPIIVEAEGLPAGVSAEPVVIAADGAQAPIIFTASASSPSKLGPIRLVGRPLGDDGQPTADGPSRVAVAGTITRPPSGGRTPIAPARVTRGLMLAVRPDAPLRLSAGPATAEVVQGGEVELTATVSRREGDDAELSLTADALPNRVNAPNAKIEKGKDAGTLKFTVPGNAKPGVYTILLRAGGKVSVPDPSDPAKTKDVTVSEPSNPIILTIKKK